MPCIMQLQEKIVIFLMQLEIILIGVTSSEMLFSEHFCNYFEKILLISAKRSGERCKLHQWETNTFLDFA